MQSSNDEHSDEEPPYQSGPQAGNEEGNLDERASKRRKGRACDICRRRKIKCDGEEASSHSCTNCVTSKSLCTYADTRKRQVPIRPDYVEVLKLRNQKLESLLSQLFPNANLDEPDLTAEDLRRSLMHTASTPTDNTVPIGEKLVSVPVHDARISSAESKQESDPPLWMHARRFHGQSSGAMLLREALNVKRESLDSTSISSDFPVLLHSNGLSGLAISYYMDNADGIVTNEPSPTYMFPPEDLMESLICLFFDHVNPLLPILHGPTFNSLYRSNFHTQDPDFAAVVLLVCAAGSRYTDDIRVLPADQQKLDEQSNGRWHSAGLDYFTQVYRFLGRPLAHAPTLSNLQQFALACLYLQGSKSATHEWALSGFGIRLALEAGAHRRKADETLCIEGQLWNRAFWALVTLDRFGSASTGRPWAIQDEDIDVDFPVAVDDEYWNPPDPNDAWKQPSGKPAIAEYFRAMLKLLEILTFALRTVYSNERSRQMLGLVGPSWEQRVVAELDSTLNKWVDMMPDHLRWNPHQENHIFFNQSALLNCIYYHIQTIVHRPFVTRSKESSPLSFPSLAICTNAARSSSHIMDVQRRRGGSSISMVKSAFTAGIVLLLNIWGIQRLGLRADPARHMLDVFKCMDWLKSHSKRWPRAQLAWDTLSILLSAGDFPHPCPSAQPHTLAGMKRPRGPDERTSPDETAGASSPGPSAAAYTQNSNAIHLRAAPSFVTPSQLAIGQLHSLPSQSAGAVWQSGTGGPQMEGPFTGADLGLLPLYPEFYYEGVTQPEQYAPAAHETPYPIVSPLNHDEGTVLPRISDVISYAGPDVDRQMSIVDSGTSLSGATTSGQQEPGDSLGDDTATQSFDTHQELFLGHDTLSMWATAPTTFEAGAWGEFAQAFQQEDQPASW